MTSLVAHSRRLENQTAWIFSDGKAGHEAQCLGVVEALGLEAEIKRVSPSGIAKWAAPWGPVARAGGFRRRRLAAWSSLAGLRLRDGPDDDPLHPGAQTPRRSCDVHGDPDGPADRTEERRLDLGPGARSPPRRQRPSHSDGAAPFFAREDKGTPRQRSASHRRVTVPARCMPHRRSQRRLYIHRCRREPARSGSRSNRSKWSWLDGDGLAPDPGTLCRQA